MAFFGPHDRKPKPNPRYAQIAAAFRAAGVSVKDDDFEKIDSFIENCTRRKSRGANSMDVLVAKALLKSNCASQDDHRDGESTDRLIAGYLPLRQFLKN